MSSVYAFLCFLVCLSTARAALGAGKKCLCSGTFANGAADYLNAYGGNTVDCANGECSFLTDAAAGKENVCYSYGFKVGGEVRGCMTITKTERGDEWTSKGESKLAGSYKVFFCDSEKCNTQTYNSASGLVPTLFALIFSALLLLRS